MIVLLSLGGGLYKSTLLERQEAPCRDKASRDYIFIYDPNLPYLEISQYTLTEIRQVEIACDPNSPYLELSQYTLTILIAQVYLSYAKTKFCVVRCNLCASYNPNCV
jgi:Asp-tRNA(Asn)/Glu-tRNA(Gln) amidotransferase B subunit